MTEPETPAEKSQREYEMDLMRANIAATCAGLAQKEKAEAPKNPRQ